MTEGGRDLSESEIIGGTLAVFPDDHSCADLGQAMSAVPAPLQAGFTAFGLKPSQFSDDVGELEGFRADVMRRAVDMGS